MAFPFDELQPVIGAGSHSSLELLQAREEEPQVTLGAVQAEAMADEAIKAADVLSVPQVWYQKVAVLPHACQTAS